VRVISISLKLFAEGLRWFNITPFVQLVKFQDLTLLFSEHHQIKTKDFPLFHPQCRFTDDTVLTVAIADVILSGRPYIDSVKEIGRCYPGAGYGGSYIQWLHSDDTRPYNSWGNGSVMRASPAGFAFSCEDEILRHAKMTAEITHNHPEGIKGAQATALAVFLARMGTGKEQIRSRFAKEFGYNMNRTVDDIRPTYTFDVSCQGTVPEAIIAFLDSDSYEDAVRNAISLGGDSDTLACITGSVAEAFYGDIPKHVQEKVHECLTPDLWQVTEAFCQKYR